MHEIKGFTFAEVLITLGVIGIVAALTLPSVIQNYQKKVTVERLKKTYSTLAQAIQMSVKDNDEERNNSGGAFCSALIMLDGWKISDDYKW